MSNAAPAPTKSSDAPSRRWLALASRSPRRLGLLRQAGFEPIVIEPGVDDSHLTLGTADPLESALALAYFKAAAGRLAPAAAGRVVLAADTFVVHAGAVIGKPCDQAEAERFVRLLCDAEHDVVTGVAMLDNRREPTDARRRWSFVDRARVHIGRISDKAIRRYIASGQWRGKAGAYNLADRLDAGWPIEYEGDPATIMGLPMRTLTPILSRLAASVHAPAEPVR